MDIASKPQPRLAGGPTWLGSLVGPLALRAISVGGVGLFSVVAAHLVGLADYSLVALSLATTSLVSALATGGVGRALLAGVEGPVVSRLVEGVVIAQLVHVLVMASLLAAGAAEGWSTVLPYQGWAVVGFGLAHSATAGLTQVFSDSFRAQGRDWLADLFHGRLGGVVSSLGGLLILGLLVVAGVSVSPVVVVGSIAVSTSLAAVVGVKVAGLAVSDSKGQQVAPGFDRRAAGVMAASLSVSPLIAGAPLWASSLVLGAQELGTLSLALQANSVVGSAVYALQSRSLRHLRVRRGPGQGDGLGRARIEHGQSLRPVIVAALVGLIGSVLVAVGVAEAVGVPSVGGFLVLVGLLGAAQVANASMGMGGTQLQLAGRASLVALVGVAQGITVFVLVVGLAATPLQVGLAIVGPGVLAPWLLGYLSVRLLAVETSPVFCRWGSGGTEAG